MSDSDAKNFKPEVFIENFRNEIMNARAQRLDKNEQYQIEQAIIDKAVNYYVNELDLDARIARAALLDILPKSEKPLDVEQELRKCMLILKTIGPQVNGVVQREQDVTMALRQIKLKLVKLEDIEDRMSYLQNELDVQKQTFRQAIKLVTESHVNIGLMDVIKCSLKNLLSSLKKSLRL